ncbi:complement factor H-related protein 4-like [Penaeus monodon]|uniref:complement factor H-related protein 4-like n=1 Tax=Penaeus monodon TaxID=6687 RepID=UPI0018A7977D|nr:complement factor H-related protein 4-like [Penaeus monodon]
MSITNNATFRYHTFGLTYACDYMNQGMRTVDLQATQTYTCTEITNSTYNGTHDGDFNYTYSYRPEDELLHCNRCAVSPSIAGATHTYSADEVYVINDTITATCRESYLLELDVTEQTVPCLHNGWNFRGCVRVCLATPSVRNATTTHHHDMWEVGEEVTATCNGDLYFADAQVQTRQVLCTYNGWMESPGCETVCKEKPVVVNATVDWSDTRMRKVGEAVTATCLPGHGVTGARSETVQQVTCTDHDWEQKPACELLVCTDTPTVGNATVGWSAGLWLVGQVINATCLDGYHLLSDGATEQALACTMGGWETKPACRIACLDQPDFGAANSTWTPRLWLEGETVDASCAEDHLDANGNAQQTVECAEGGWRDPSPCMYVPPGAVICSGEPTVPSADTDWFAAVWMVGSVVNATCLSGHYALDVGSDVRVQAIACTESGWENVSACVRVCEDSPGDFGSATTDWQDRKYHINETVFATCQEDHRLADDSANQTVRCTESGWETPLPCLLVQCPGPEVANAVEQFNSTMFNVSQEVVVTCLDGHFLRRGVQVQTLECGIDRAWGEILPCVGACEGEPLVQNANITWNESEFWTVGNYVVATCYPEFSVSPNVYTHHVTCTEQGWDETTRCFTWYGVYCTCDQERIIRLHPNPGKCFVVSSIDGAVSNLILKDLHRILASVTQPHKRQRDMYSFIVSLLQPRHLLQMGQTIINDFLASIPTLNRSLTASLTRVLVPS